MAGCYTHQGPWFDVDDTLKTLADVLESPDLPYEVQGALEGIVDPFRCETCNAVRCQGEGPGVCACDRD